MTFDQGTYRIRCQRPGGLTLQGYGQFSFKQDQEVDLLDEALPPTLRAGSYATAHNMCADQAYELAQLIAAGDLVVVERRSPRITKA